MPRKFPNWVSEAEASRIKGVSKEAIRQAVKRGALECVVISPHHHLIPLESLRRYTPNPKLAGPRKRHASR